MKIGANIVKGISLLLLMTALTLYAAELDRAQLELEVKIARDMIHHLVVYAQIYRGVNGSYPINWKQLMEIDNAVPEGATITVINGTQHLVYKGWNFIFLTRNIYNDKYDPREVMGLAAFRANKDDPLSYVFFRDSTLGTFFKRFKPGIEIKISKYCGVNDETGIADWKHIPIEDK